MKEVKQNGKLNFKTTNMLQTILAILRAFCTRLSSVLLVTSPLNCCPYLYTRLYSMDCHTWPRAGWGRTSCRGNITPRLESWLNTRELLTTAPPVGYPNLKAYDIKINSKMNMKQNACVYTSNIFNVKNIRLYQINESKSAWTNGILNM